MTPEASNFNSHSPTCGYQVIIDMREGRKWNVQIALISQSLDDFDKIMIEFATSIFIMDAYLPLYLSPILS